MKKIILGLGCGSGHDSGATLINGNELIAAIEEERLNRQKHYGNFPYMSVDFCLKNGNIKNEKVDNVIIGWTPYGNFFEKIKFLTSSPLNIGSSRRKLRFVLQSYFRDLKLGYIAKKIFPNAKINFIEHHIAHAASAFFLSNFDKSNIVTLDGRGDWSTGLLGIGEGNNINKLQESFWPQSIGLLYLAFTNFLGFGFGDEYKVMGLAAYGKPKYLEQIRKIFNFHPKKMFNIDLRFVQHPTFSTNIDWGEVKYFSPLLEKNFGKSRKPNEQITNFHMDIASSIQSRLNEVGIEIVDHLIEKTSSTNLCCAGGVFLNGIMNYKIYKETNIKNIFIQPASNDGGISLGAALFGYHSLNKNEKRIEFNHAYWGSSFTNQEIKKELENHQIKYYKLKNTPEVAAKLIYNGKIIGWFQGRSELGPRALGSRSILADPRPAKNKDIVNERIKFREEFRPFAPSILEEFISEWFELDTISPYMLMIPKVKENKKNIIQAVTHVDGTARPQTVNQFTNPKYYSLIKYFLQLTNCPIILNTSFNIKNEPIVDNPIDAIRCFYTTGLDYLIIGDYILSKNIFYEEIKKIDAEIM